MKDFIEKLISELEEAEETKCLNDYGGARAYLDSIRIVNELAEEYNDGWIPCSDKLPEEHDSIFAEFKGTDKWRDGMFEKTSDDVNVTVKYENGTVKTKTMHTVDGKWKKDSVVKCEVTHWQPLPVPCQMKEGGVGTYD